MFNERIGDVVEQNLATQCVELVSIDLLNCLSEIYVFE